MLGAERVSAIDRLPERFNLAREQSGTETINFEEVNTYDALLGRR
jgi:threonine dehydrogenase-like Zn-dependent dehydrogenase